MSYYKGNLSAPDSVDMGDLQDPYYWWTAGALWGAMLDYYHLTNDSTYNDVVTQALLAPTNLGAQHSYMPPEHAFEEGNDDLFFWGSAAIAAAERNFPQPNATLPSWLDMGANVFNQLAGRWSTQHCGGGLLWQIYASNPNGLTYKNSVSNGGFFQIAARMARATGNDTYLAWAERIWDWSVDVGFVDREHYHVYDGASIGTNCTETNPASFTYTSGIYLYGAAVMANYTGRPEWKRRAEQLLDGAGWFFNSPNATAENVMFEGACETVGRCNADMTTFKGYLSRFMWQSTQMVPSLRAKVESLLVPSARAAAATCTGGPTGRACGQKWYVGGYDGIPGLGQEMCALETVQGLLIREAAPPLEAGDIKTVRDASWTVQAASAPKPVQTTTKRGVAGDARPTGNSAGARLGLERGPLVVVGLGVLLATWGLA
ncbi:glycosyl hydrolase [Trichoderma cornu-damae]|uniref:Mannan endo-1,6-alpha-mannosidase n=1 Tax=Trichoderma cornu-damae TaxID=654480 RepID=A0A9P8TWH9_9HYPO|nr:glycosyl hydrolase [Trichoderma cornu-damae]